MTTIGSIIDRRPDGTYIYMSHRGILNLDNYSELREEEKLDIEWLGHHAEE